MRGISLSKAYEASFAIYLAALLVSLRWESLSVSLGLTVGTALAMGLLASWQWIIRRTFDAAAPRKGPAIAFGMAKIPIVGAIVYAVVGLEWASPLAFAAGFAVPQIAVTLLAIGARSTPERDVRAHDASRA